jgi:hypothetical protein
MSVFRILHSFGLGHADPIRSVLDVAEDRSFSPSRTLVLAKSLATYPTISTCTCRWTRSTAEPAGTSAILESARVEFVSTVKPRYNDPRYSDILTN